MPISKIKTSSITADAASVNLNIDANTLFLDVANNRVGVGTTSPGNQLVVYGTGGDAVSLFSGTTTTGAADTGNAITFSGHDGAVLGRLFGRVGVYKENSTVGDVSSYMSFGTRLHPSGTVEKIRIDSAGNLGIGTTTPSSYGKLAIESGNIGFHSSVSNGLEMNRIQWNNNIYDNASIRAIVGAGQINRGELGFYVNNGASQQLAMYIDYGQNLGLGGNSTPDRPVHLKSSGNRNYIKAETTTNSPSNESGFEIKTPSAAFLIGALGNTNALWIYDTNATAERLRINSSGNLQVGHSNTGYPSKLSVVDQIRVLVDTAGSSSSSKMNANSTNDLIVLNAPYNSNPSGASNFGAKWGIKFTGGMDTGSPGNLDTIGKSSGIYAVSEEIGSAGYNRATGLTFYTNQQDTNYVERFRVSKDGKVAVNTGTTNPSDIRGSDFGQLHIIGDNYAPISYRHQFNTFRMFGKIIQSYANNTTAFTLMSIYNFSGNLGVWVTVRVRTVGAVANIGGDAVGYAFIRTAASGGFQIATINQQPTATFNYNTGTQLGTLAWINTGTSTPSLTWTPTSYGYSLSSFDVEVTCRDGGGVFFDNSYQSIG